MSSIRERLKEPKKQLKRLENPPIDKNYKPIYDYHPVTRALQSMRMKTPSQLRKEKEKIDSDIKLLRNKKNPVSDKIVEILSSVSMDIRDLIKKEEDSTKIKIDIRAILDDGNFNLYAPE